MSTQVDTLAAAAGAAAAAGNWLEAERLWRQVRQLDPGNVQALFSLGVHAFQRGDSTGAQELLELAKTQAPRDPMIPLTLAKVHGNADRVDDEWNAIMASLAIDAYFLPALLAKGEFLERRGKPRAAAAVYRDVFKVAPPEQQWPAVLRRRLATADAALRRDTEELVDFLAHRIDVKRTAVHAALQSRWDEAVSILAGRTKPYHSECNQLHVPRLPAQPFYERSMFPWIDEIEAHTAVIQSELDALVSGRLEGFEPYVAYKPGDPVNQWGELNHSRSWSSYHLWVHGQPVHGHLSRCPRTAEALEALDAVRIDGLCPNAMFSALAPRTRIPPHTGETNARLVAHLPLVVPDGCAFRVGHDWRTWQEGKVFVFDDSIEHEARNDSAALRVVLIFDVWNPLLTAAERELVTTLASAMREYRGRVE